FCEQFSELFTQVLLVCAQAGMVDAGLIALDGTKVQANASVDANKTEDRLRVMAQEIVAEAQEVDAVEDRAEDDDEGGRRARDARARAALADRDRRARVIEGALDSIEAERRQRPDRRSQQVQRRLERAVEVEARVRAEVEDRAQAYQDRVAAGSPRPGRPPVPPEENKQLRSAQDNLARCCPRRGWVRGWLVGGPSARCGRGDDYRCGGRRGALRGARLRWCRGARRPIPVPGCG